MGGAVVVDGDADAEFAGEGVGVAEGLVDAVHEPEVGGEGGVSEELCAFEGTSDGVEVGGEGGEGVVDGDAAVVVLADDVGEGGGVGGVADADAWQSGLEELGADGGDALVPEVAQAVGLDGKVLSEIKHAGLLTWGMWVGLGKKEP